MTLTPLEELEIVFGKLKIEINNPGFYDDPNFIIQERRDYTFLEKYAEYVLQRHYDQEYITKAKKVIPIICDLLYNELERDGRLGACIDISMALSRFLENEGFWNYINKSSLTIQFPKETNIQTKFFWPNDFGEFVAAHSYVVAPPFKIIDLTINLQDYSSNEAKYIPKMIVSEEAIEAGYVIDDLMSPQFMFLWAKKTGTQGDDLINLIMPRLRSISKRFKPVQVEKSGVRAKYVQYGISAPSGPLVEMNSLSLNGRNALEIYNEVIKPCLEKVRAL